MIIDNLIIMTYRKLGLDLVPRVDGEMVDPDCVSVVELHQVVSKGFSKSTLGLDSLRTS